MYSILKGNLCYNRKWVFSIVYWVFFESLKSFNDSKNTLTNNCQYWHWQDSLEHRYPIQIFRTLIPRYHKIQTTSMNDVFPYIIGTIASYSPIFCIRTISFPSAISWSLTSNGSEESPTRIKQLLLFKTWYIYNQNINMVGNSKRME